jgi:16S rRNA (cytidine1402-2'-O)-methyltransferase
MLYIIATPIGNLEDITLRALGVLKECDLIICENKKRALKLLHYYKIKKPLISIKDYELKKIEKISNEVIKKKCALISDSGTPLISDPGLKLLKSCLKKGCEITAIPGPCAAINALVLSSLRNDKFIFLGYLPLSKKRRVEVLSKSAILGYPCIIYESKRRIRRLLEEINELFPKSEVSVAKEMTKLNEKVWRGKINDVLQQLEPDPLGEYTLVALIRR